MEGTEPFEIGVWTGGEGQGKRNDLKVGIDLLKAGGLKRIAEQEPALFVKYHRGFAALEQFSAKPGKRQSPRTTYVLVGPSGVGKTRWAFDRYGENLYVSPVGQSKSAIWFDGYGGEKAALLDDFRGSISFEDLLKLTDPWYDHRVPIKGGYVIWKPDVVIITSNAPHTTWYTHLTAYDLTPLERRITQIDIAEIDILPTQVPEEDDIVSVIFGDD